MLPLVSWGQQVSLITPISDSIKETSGLVLINGKLITHNDSGDDPVLHEIDTASGQVSRTVTVSNASNTDWEDICTDNNYIYIGDFGNNSGSRMDLRIYRILISDYMSASNDTVTADTIQFSYADQTDFTPSTFTTNFDAESIVSLGDSLFIFTKNWGDNWTNVYAMPNLPGTYSAPKIDSIDAQGLVTGATNHPGSGIVLLTGHTVTQPFVILLRDYVGTSFSAGTVTRTVITTPATYSIQIEGAACQDPLNFYLSAEGGLAGNAGLYKLRFDPPSRVLTIQKYQAGLYPNPARTNINVSGDLVSEIEILDLLGRVVMRSNKSRSDISHLQTGAYIVNFRHADGMLLLTKKLTVH
jgi:hypothetical protein